MAVSVTHTFVSSIADNPQAAAAGEVLPSHWNATHTVSGIRTMLSADTNFYVASTGSDSNDGLTSGTAQATLAHMVNTIASNYDGGGHNITINVASGTYAGAQIIFPPNYNFYSVLGAGSASTTIQDGGGLYCLGPNTVTGNSFIFGGMTLDANTTNCAGFEPQGAGLSFLGDSTFSGTNPVAFTTTSGQGSDCIALGGFGTNDWQSVAAMTISGTWISAFAVLFQGNIANPTANIVLSGTPTWTQGFIDAFGGQYEMDGNFSGSGSTGPAFQCAEPSIVNFNVPNNVPGSSWGVFLGELNYYDGTNFILLEVDAARRVKVKTGNYQLVADDRDARIEMNLAGANTVTIPTNATIGGAGWIIGTEIRVTQIGAGNTTIAGAVGVTLHNGGALSGQWGSAIIYNRALDEWVQTTL